ncbi:hypothetical protein, partial [Methylobacterium sp.]|uniref:hypothetical protein n=1 Tax=Methylobacterium sp. TaxID=409 RepID=UPI0025D37169
MAVQFVDPRRIGEVVANVGRTTGATMIRICASHAREDGRNTAILFGAGRLGSKANQVMTHYRPRRTPVSKRVGEPVNRKATVHRSFLCTSAAAL